MIYASTRDYLSSCLDCLEMASAPLLAREDSLFRRRINECILFGLGSLEFIKSGINVAAGFLQKR